jgi:hypothetical protein
MITSPTLFKGLAPLFFVNMGITGCLALLQQPHWVHYAIGSTLGLFYFASMVHPKIHPAVASGLSLIRMAFFGLAICWLGNFELAASTVVMIGCFSYKWGLSLIAGVSTVKQKG